MNVKINDRLKSVASLVEDNSKVIDITNKVQGYGEIDLKSEFELSDDVKLKLSMFKFFILKN